MAAGGHRPARLSGVVGHRETGRVGLLGGSFNPAHRGHRHISVEALRRLRLDEIWWLVSPQNPLKASDGMAALDARMARARAVAAHPRIRVTDAERHFGTRYTVDTVAALRRRFPRVRFVWLMGADIMIQMPRWSRWPRLFGSLPVAVFARPNYISRAMAGKAAHRFRRDRVPLSGAGGLAGHPPPAWTFIPIPLDDTSATDIRTRLVCWPPR
ncbi:MAG: nicotinate-nucleotide adenylyltransferase [Alphaproteobacteria bacterium]